MTTKIRQKHPFYLVREALQDFNESNFIYVPSINLHVAKEKSPWERDWRECHEILKDRNYRMPKINEFREFLSYLKNSDKEEYLDIYDNIIVPEDPYEAEWLNSGLENVLPSEFENTLMESKIISLDNWVGRNYTKQGLPTKNVKKGNFGEEILHYLPPEHNSVTLFNRSERGICLDCKVITGGFDKAKVRPVREN